MPTCHGNSRDARGSASAASAPPNMPVLMNMLVPAAAASSLAAATRRPVRGNCRVDVDTTAAARDPLSARTECVNETADEAAFFFASMVVLEASALLYVSSSPTLARQYAQRARKNIDDIHAFAAASVTTEGFCGGQRRPAWVVPLTHRSRTLGAPRGDRNAPA